MTDEEFEDYFKNLGWKGCTLVNPACPDDLCILPKYHKGLHQLMTESEPSRHWIGIRRWSKGTTAKSLVQEGSRRAREIYSQGD